MSGRLFYQPIGIPNGSSGAAAVAAAANSIGGGIETIGAGLTRLSERRAKRRTEEQQRLEASALESIGLLAQGAGSEAELNALADELIGRAGRGEVPTGAAALLAGRENDLLANAVTRETGRSSRIENDTAQLDLDDRELLNAFGNEFGADINEARRLASIGDLTGAQAIEQDILARAGSRFGTNPSGLFEGTLDLLTKGDDARTGVEENALTLTGIRQDQRIQREEAADANRSRDTAFADGRVDRSRADAQFERNEQTDVAFANILGSSIDKSDALRRIQDTNLDPRVKQNLAQLTEEAFTNNPDILDTFNPLDPNATIDRIYNQTDRVEAGINGALQSIGLPGGIQLNSNSDLDPRAVTASILDTTDRIFQGNSSLGIWNDAQSVREEVGRASIPDMGAFLQERFSNAALPDKWKNRIERAQRRHNLTDSEVVAIADRSLRARGANFLGVNLLPGGERADEQILDVDEFDKLAADYDKNNTGNLAAEGQTLRDAASRATELQAEIPRLIDARQRAIGSDRADAAQERARIERKITDYQDELAGLEVTLNRMLPNERGEAPDLGDTLRTIRQAPLTAAVITGARLRN